MYNYGVLRDCVVHMEICWDTQQLTYGLLYPFRLRAVSLLFEKPWGRTKETPASTIFEGGVARARGLAPRSSNFVLAQLFAFFPADVLAKERLLAV